MRGIGEVNILAEMKTYLGHSMNNADHSFELSTVLEVARVGKSYCVHQMHRYSTNEVKMLTCQHV